MLIWSIIIGLILILICLGLYVGNYFFQITLVRKNTWYTTSGQKLVSVTEPTPQQEHADAEWNRQLQVGQAYYNQEGSKPVSIKSHDGLTLQGRYIIEHPESNRFAICVHGYRATGVRDMGYIAYELANMGLNTLIPDLRSHGLSEGKYIGMGWPEHLDIMLWIDDLLTRYPDAEIMLVGCSMGAATIMMNLGEQLPSNVKLAMADCGYTSAKREFGYVLQSAMKLPQQPILFFANLVTKIRTGYSLYQASSIKALPKNTLPILFIHGSADTFVPVTMMAENIQATQGPYEKLIIENAPHFASSSYQPELYFHTIQNFIATYWQ